MLIIYVARKQEANSLNSTIHIQQHTPLSDGRRKKTDSSIIGPRCRSLSLSMVSICIQQDIFVAKLQSKSASSFSAFHILIPLSSR